MRSTSDGGGAGPRGGSRRRANVAPALWLAGATAVLVFAILTLSSSWLRGERSSRAAHPRPAATLAPEVDLWVGELAPGVRGVLASEWNDPDVDARYDEALNRDLGLDGSAGATGVAYYRLVAFNTTDKPVTLAFKDGGISIAPKGEAPMPMKSLAALLTGSDGRAAPSSAQAATLRLLGAAREAVEVPPGGRHSHPIAFERRVPLGAADGVATADGTAFHARRIPGRLWAGILEGPAAAEVKDL